ncbi:hypothetical protein EIK77_003195 [Talaromyces pinophilus]|nr:hypothetical protein EIK77_003195 [Talaromyces pinophilus]
MNKNPCVRYAKQIGTEGHFCIADGTTSKCLWCYNQNSTWQRIPQDCIPSIYDTQVIIQSGNMDKPKKLPQTWKNLVDPLIRKDSKSESAGDSELQDKIRELEEKIKRLKDDIAEMIDTLGQCIPHRQVLNRK